VVPSLADHLTAILLDVSLPRIAAKSQTDFTNTFIAGAILALRSRRHLPGMPVSAARAARLSVRLSACALPGAPSRTHVRPNAIAHRYSASR
jgi:hypothetical protein